MAVCVATTKQNEKSEKDRNGRIDSFIHLDSFRFIQIHLDSFRFIQIHSD